MIIMLALPSRRILCLAHLLAVLGGCAAWPAPPQRPAEPTPPAGWVESRGAAAAAPVSSPEAPWWQTLQDPQLDSLQRLVLQANLDSVRAAMHWQNALTDVRLSTLARQPQPSLNLSAGASRALHSGTASVVVDGLVVPVTNAPSTSHSYGSRTSLSYELDLWSRLAQGTRIAEAQAASRHEDWRSARWLASTKVAEAYWTIAAIDAKLPMLTELSQAADEAVRIVQLQLEEGVLRADEVDKFIAKQFQARKRLADAQAGRRQQLYELALLMDRDPPALAPGDARLPSHEPGEPDLGTPAQTLERRPDVRQARLAVDAALARLHVSEAARYPSLTLNLSLGTTGIHWRDWFSQPTAALSQSLVVPLVDWRRLDAERDKARNSLDEAALALRASVRQALVDVENALLERERWQQQWQAAQLQRQEREKAHAVTRLRQEVGVRGRLDVLQSRHDLLDARLEIIELRLTAWKNLLNLYKALGGAV
jgi:NodT family efflux transporter outer membrane factor (OMF) lipoprotein